MKSLPWISQLGLKVAAGLLSPAGQRASLIVLTYHRVLDRHDPLLPDEPDIAVFYQHMHLLKSLFNVLPLSEAVKRLKDGSLPARAVCITFDDGYANNLKLAVPILKAYGLPATVFVSTGFISGGMMWNDIIIENLRASKGELNLSKLNLGVYSIENNNDRCEVINQLINKIKYLDPMHRMQKVNAITEITGISLSNDVMMSESQIKELYGAGIELGAHTVNHPILTQIEDIEALHEIRNSKHTLESITGAPVACFAYPNGRPYRDYDERHVRMVHDCGFIGAVSTAWGASRRKSDVLQLPRIAPWDTTALRYAIRMIKTYLDPPSLSASYVSPGI